MATYGFKAVDLAGVPARGQVEAASEQAVSDQLRGRGLIVLDDKFSSKLTIASTKLGQLGQKWETVGTKMAATGAALTRTVSLPLAAVGAGALVVAAKFDEYMARLKFIKQRV